MAENKFKAFLEKRRPFGDAVDLPFVDHAVDDPSLPDPTSWEELEGYIKKTNPKVPTDVLNAAKHIWQLYETVPPAGRT